MRSLTCAPRPCVLVVDDDDDVRSNVAEILADEGYRVLQAANGREALDVLLHLSAAERPGCVLLDLMMPVMDGRTFLQTIAREHKDELGDIAIVVWTAKGSADEALAGLAPRYPLLKKPIDLDELLDAIARACRVPASGAEGAS